MSFVWRTEVEQADIERVGQLVARTGFFNPGEVQIAKELVEERCLKGESSGYFFVMCDDQDGSLRGYACYGLIPCTESSWDLYWIAVDPALQRAGVGRALMQQVEQQVVFLGGTRLYADTSGRAQYSSTRLFYERCGYHSAADLEDFYAPGDSKRIYAKRLV